MEGIVEDCFRFFFAQEICMKKIIIVLALMTLSFPAFAGGFSGSVGAVSDYVLRGRTQSDGSPAIQYTVKAEKGGFYVKSWGSQVDFNNDTSAEVHAYVGAAWETDSPFSFDLGYKHISYIGDEISFSDDIAEVYGTINLGPISTTLYRNVETDTNYYTGSLSVGEMLGLPFGASVFAGRNTVDETDYGISISKSFHNFVISYSYTDMDIDEDVSAHSVGIFYNF